MLSVSEKPGRPETIPAEVHSPDSRYDGSRTSPEVQFEIMRRHRDGMAISAIADDCHCDPRTVKAVIQNWGTSQHRLRLEAHRSQVVDSVILGMKEAASRGKLDSILSLSDRLGITEAPKTQNGNQVAVQINLHGGPEPVSLAKVEAESETPQIQAPFNAGLITQLMDTAQPIDAQVVSEPSMPQGQPTGAHQAAPTADTAQLTKQAE